MSLIVKSCVLVFDGDNVLINRRDNSSRWEFPNFPIDNDPIRSIITNVKKEYDLDIIVIGPYFFSSYNMENGDILITLAYTAKLVSGVPQSKEGFYVSMMATSSLTYCELIDEQQELRDKLRGVL